MKKIIKKSFFLKNEISQFDEINKDIDNKLKNFFCECFF